ncbi:rod-binding protein [candidate division WOR-3 bacterium]|nr:rod-binding protein [candidate division WOR-3 bacterium]
MNIDTGLVSRELLNATIKGAELNEDQRKTHNLKRSFEAILNEKNEKMNEKQKKEYNKKLMDASQQMEALFIQIMLRSMKKTVHESGFFGKSLAKDIFSDMLYEEYSKIMAKSGQFGLAKEIYEQLQK